MSDEDPFGTATKPTKPKSPYASMHHPVTKKLIGRHVRVTNFIKGLTDDFGLVQWQKRMVAQGLALRPDLIENVQNLAGENNSTALDGICAMANKAAGGEDASNWGTHVHKQTEYADLGITEKRDPECADRIQEYQEAIQAAGITIIPELIERKICHTGLSSLVTGTFDRIVKLSDGTHAILDVKTGSLDPESYCEKWLGIAAQMEIYRQAAAQHGVWNPQTKMWEPAPALRDDFAIVAHIPAKGTGCTLYEVPLEDGRHALGVLDALRTFRRRKPAIEEYTPRTVVDIKAMVQGWAGKVHEKNQVFVTEVDYLIETAVTESNLMALVQRARDLGVWDQQLSDLARARHAAITGRA